MYNANNASIPQAVIVNEENIASAPVVEGVYLEFPNPTSSQTGGREYLQTNKWPKGLQDAFFQNLQKIPIRFFICDDSGSMSLGDGHRLVTTNGISRFVSCTRWSELTSALTFHANIAKQANAPTEFRFLNNSAPIVIGDGLDPENTKFQKLMSILQNSSPSGGTPLCYHIAQVVNKIQLIAPQLRANGQKACVVIATDGESSDGDIASALRPLQSLPVWVVIRLCTDEDKIVDYWNNIDSQLELDMDVLDDLEGEAEEIKEHNPWLTYTEALHRMREFGVVIKEMDLLDEATLSMDQIRCMCAMLFGGSADDYPHPDEDFAGFQRSVQMQMNRVGKQFDPITKSMKHFIRFHRMKGHSRLRCVMS